MAENYGWMESITDSKSVIRFQLVGDTCLFTNVKKYLKDGITKRIAKLYPLLKHQIVSFAEIICAIEMEKTAGNCVIISSFKRELKTLHNCVI